MFVNLCCCHQRLQNSCCFFIGSQQLGVFLGYLAAWYLLLLATLPVLIACCACLSKCSTSGHQSISLKMFSRTKAHHFILQLILPSPPPPFFPPKGEGVIPCHLGTLQSIVHFTTYAYLVRISPSATGFYYYFFLLSQLFSAGVIQYEACWSQMLS